MRARIIAAVACAPAAALVACAEPPNGAEGAAATSPGPTVGVAPSRSRPPAHPPDRPPDRPPQGPVILPIPLRLVGTEPFWGGVIGIETISLEGAGREPLHWGAVDPARKGRTLRWSLAGADIVVVQERCSDGMSDRVYPFRAEVRAWGGTLRGCAGPESLFRRER